MHIDGNQECHRHHFHQSSNLALLHVVFCEPSRSKLLLTMMPTGSHPLSEAVVRELVKSLHESGQLAGLVNELASGSASAGSMSDASKRRLNSVGESDDEFQVVDGTIPPSKKQAPILPGDKKNEKTPSAITLPSGIQSVSHWGQTVCDLPKVAHLEMSYAELIGKANSDSMVAGYLKWAYSAGVKSDKVDDLQAYLKAINWNPKTKSVDQEKTDLTYPGTGYVRRMK